MTTSAASHVGGAIQVLRLEAPEFEEAGLLGKLLEEVLPFCRMGHWESHPVAVAADDLALAILTRADRGPS